MLSYIRLSDGTDPFQGALVTGTGFASLFCPSARASVERNVGEAGRSRQLTFSVGYKERVQIHIVGGGVWKWRRLVFTLKGSALYEDPNTEWNLPWYDKSVDTADCDMVRLINQPTPDQAAAIRAKIWDGTEGVDWASEFTAKVDTSRITPLYDRVKTFNPGNESGMSRTFRLWHPTRKNLMYDEDEGVGPGSFGGAYASVDGKPGMGDLYVYDIMFLAVPAAAGNASCTFDPEGTYYWHER